MNQIELKNKIRQLINQREKHLTNFLNWYQNNSSILALLAEFDETEEEVLWANLTWRAIGRNNHQHLSVSDFKTQFDGNLLAAIEQELALITANNWNEFT